MVATMSTGKEHRSRPVFPNVVIALIETGRDDDGIMSDERPPQACMISIS